MVLNTGIPPRIPGSIRVWGQNRGYMADYHGTPAWRPIVGYSGHLAGLGLTADFDRKMFPESEPQYTGDAWWSDFEKKTAGQIKGWIDEVNSAANKLQNAVGWAEEVKDSELAGILRKAKGRLMELHSFLYEAMQVVHPNYFKERSATISGLGGAPLAIPAWVLSVGLVATCVAYYVGVATKAYFDARDRIHKRCVEAAKSSKERIKCTQLASVSLFDFSPSTQFFLGVGATGLLVWWLNNRRK